MTVGRPELAVGGVVVDSGALLLVRRATPPQVGRWTVPGGRVERNERVAAAVEREVAEETGLTVRCGELIGWVERIAADHHFVILDFAATLVRATTRAGLGPGASARGPDGPGVGAETASRPRPRPGGDAAAARWVPLTELAAVDLVEGLAAFLRTHGVSD